MVTFEITNKQTTKEQFLSDLPMPIIGDMISLEAKLIKAELNEGVISYDVRVRNLKSINTIFYEGSNFLEEMKELQKKENYRIHIPEYLMSHIFFEGIDDRIKKTLETKELTYQTWYHKEGKKKRERLSMEKVMYRQIYSQLQNIEETMNSEKEDELSLRKNYVKRTNVLLDLVKKINCEFWVQLQRSPIDTGKFIHPQERIIDEKNIETPEEKKPDIFYTGYPVILHEHIAPVDDPERLIGSIYIK